MEFLLFNKSQFFWQQIAHKSINPFFFWLSNMWIFASSIFFTTDTIRFHCFYIICSTEVSGFFISSFISLYSLNILFTETSSSWLIYESIKVLEIRTSMVFSLSFPNSTTLSYYFFFFYTIDLFFLIPAVIKQIFIPTAGTQTSEANLETETEPVTVETRINKCLTQFNTYMSFYTFQSLNHNDLFLLKDNFLLHLFF